MKIYLAGVPGGGWFKRERERWLISGRSVFGPTTSFGRKNRT